MKEIEFWENFGYWRNRLDDIYAHIRSGMAEEENPFCRKGIIVEKGKGTESRLDFVLDYLKVSKLMEEGKVSELVITDDWDEDILPSANNENSRECWNTIINRAFEAKDGLLILHVSNMKLFEHCWWHIKQLAKQEDELVAWGDLEESSVFFDIDSALDEIDHLARIGCSEQEIDEFADESVAKARRKGLIPSRFEFNGYVLLVLDGLDWESVRKQSMRNQPGEFDAAMQFYSRIDF